MARSTEEQGMNRIQAKKLKADIDKRAEEVVKKLQQKGIIDKPLSAPPDKHDSTGAMAAAWFGTPGAGAAIDRVFGKHPHNDYKQLPTAIYMEQCPVCDSTPQLWQYSTSDTTPRKLVVMCSYSEKIGPQDGLVKEGCLLFMPPTNFYRETIRDAIRYWNEFAQALMQLRDTGKQEGTPHA